MTASGLFYVSGSQFSLQLVLRYQHCPQFAGLKRGLRKYGLLLPYLLHFARSAACVLGCGHLPEGPAGRGCGAPPGRLGVVIFVG